ncbi:hypothetical protein [Phenylobacterium sp.]|uniref:dioxygenase family protein n=1 Tax=Phenylobacterium sp. TaxID=1871053 RepID=UPI0035B1B885
METAKERTVTPEQIEGPYWLPGSPERQRLVEDGIVGAPLTLTGRVFKQDLTPVEGAWVDFWQCDGVGVYDFEGYRLRGHQYTDADGRYRLETIVPVEYTDRLEFAGRQFDVHRTAHLHVKVKMPRRQTLTTQLYFPGAPHNDKDQIFNAACILELSSDGRTAQFDFVLPW